MKEHMVERTIVLRVVTRCANVDQFVATFRRFSTDSAVFVPTHNQRDVGAETDFSIRLVDGAEVLAGTGAIVERHTTAENTFGKPGILIDIRKLTSASQVVFEQLRAREVFEPMADDTTQPIEMPIGRAAVATTLGVAPLAPATFASAPYVNDTPIPRWPRASTPDAAAAIVASTAPPVLPRTERTAMVALDRTSGQPQVGPWQAFCARLAGSIRSVRWWLRRRRATQQIR